MQTIGQTLNGWTGGRTARQTLNGRAGADGRINHIPHTQTNAGILNGDTALARTKRTRQLSGQPAAKLEQQATYPDSL